MKRIIILLMAMVTIIACEKESHTLTMDEALKKVEKIIKKYPTRPWYISKDIFEPCTTFQYSLYGRYNKDYPEMIHDYATPDYRAWLVMLGEDTSGNKTDPNCLYIFVNSETGKYEEVWLKGQALIEWGDDAISRYMGITR